MALVEEPATIVYDGLRIYVVHTVDVELCKVLAILCYAKTVDLKKPFAYQASEQNRIWNDRCWLVYPECSMLHENVAILLCSIKDISATPDIAERTVVVGGIGSGNAKQLNVDEI
jgi:hypothetical protein